MSSTSSCYTLLQVQMHCLARLVFQVQIPLGRYIHVFYMYCTCLDNSYRVRQTGYVTTFKNLLQNIFYLLTLSTRGVVSILTHFFNLKLQLFLFKYIQDLTDDVLTYWHSVKKLTFDISSVRPSSFEIIWSLLISV